MVKTWNYSNIPSKLPNDCHSGKIEKDALRSENLANRRRGRALPYFRFAMCFRAAHLDRYCPNTQNKGIITNYEATSNNALFQHYASYCGKHVVSLLFFQQFQ